MEYSSHKIAGMSGVSARTLRYYDEIDLLKPARVASSGYRIYGQDEVDMLQQILFYRALGFPLDRIREILTAPGFDRKAAFAYHLAELQTKRARLDMLINNVARSLALMKGETTMSDNEKFEGLKQLLIEENEKKYGGEIREKYGEQTVEESNAKFSALTPAQYEEGESLRLAFEEALVSAFASGNPAGEQAQKACDLHRQWLCVFYPHYSREYHQGLAEMYVADERFKANYDRLVPGGAAFLRDAIHVYCRPPKTGD